MRLPGFGASSEVFFEELIKFLAEFIAHYENFSNFVISEHSGIFLFVYFFVLLNYKLNTLKRNQNFNGQKVKKMQIFAIVSVILL